MEDSVGILIAMASSAAAWDLPPSDCKPVKPLKMEAKWLLVLLCKDVDVLGEFDNRWIGSSFLAMVSSFIRSTSWDVREIPANNELRRLCWLALLLRLLVPVIVWLKAACQSSKCHGIDRDFGSVLPTDVSSCRCCWVVCSEASCPTGSLSCSAESSSTRRDRTGWKDGNVVCTGELGIGYILLGSISSEGFVVSIWKPCRAVSWFNR